MKQITLTTKQIINLCNFAGIEIDKEKSCFAEDTDQMDTEFVVYQDESQTVSWLYEYPEEGSFSLDNIERDEKAEAR